MNFIQIAIFLISTLTLYIHAIELACPIMNSKKRMICYFASWAGINSKCLSSTKKNYNNLKKLN